MATQIKGNMPDDPSDRLEHASPGCTGLWELRWMRTSGMVISCMVCRYAYKPSNRVQWLASVENTMAVALLDLTQEGEALLGRKLRKRW
jgi:hypothetical protein